MIHLIPTQIAFFSAYIVLIWIFFGVLPSISDSWYRLEKKHPLFTLWLMLIGFSMVGIFVHTENPCYFVSGVCLCFTGVAAEFKQKMTGIIHGIGAVGGIVSALGGIAYDGVWEVSVIFLIGALILRLWGIKNLTFWVELWAFACIEGGFIYLASHVYS